MNAALKLAIAEKNQRKSPAKLKIVQVRMDKEMYVRAGSILRKRGMSWSGYFRNAAKVLIRESR